MAEALVNSLAPAGNLNDTLSAETQVPGIKATDDLITTLTSLVISHDRQLQTLEDRHTVIALIYGQQEKAKVRDIRDEWQRQKPGRGALHPSGASQRSVIWSQILVILQQHYCELIKKAATDGLPAVRYGEPRVQQGSPGFDIAFEALSCSEAIIRLAAIPIPEVERIVFRLRPKHPNPRNEDDKPWVWTLVLAQSASSQTIRDVEIAASYAAKPSAIKLQPQLSQDGPLVKQLVAHIKGKGKGKGKGKSKAPSGSRDHDGGQDNNKKKRKGGWWDYQEDW